MKNAIKEQVEQFKKLIDILVGNREIYNTMMNTIDSYKKEEIFIKRGDYYFKNTSLPTNNSQLYGKKKDKSFQLAVEYGENTDNYLAFELKDNNEKYRCVIKFLQNDRLDVEIIKNNEQNRKKIHRIYEKNLMICEIKEEIDNNNKEIKKVTYVNDGIAQVAKYDSSKKEIKYSQIKNYNTLFDDRRNKLISNLFEIGPSNKENFEKMKELVTGVKTKVSKHI